MKISELLANFEENEQKYFMYLIKDLDDEKKEKFLKEIYELTVLEQRILLNLLLRLSPNQLKAVIHDSESEGPLMIIGDEISNKRTILATRIAYHLIVRDIKPEEILGLTFSNSNAGTIIDTIGNSLPDKVVTNLDINTYNSTALRILNDYIFGSLNLEKIGYKASPKFRVVVAREQTLLLKRSLEESKISSDEVGGLTKLLGTIIGLKRNLISPKEALNKAKNEMDKKIANIYAIYQDKLLKNNICDANDLIRLVLILFEKSPDVLEYYKNKYKMFIVDDYHYANYAQYKLVQILTKGLKNITFTSGYTINVYGWSPNDKNYANEFKNDYPNGTVMEYERNPVDVEDILKREMFFEKGEMPEDIEPAETADFNDYIDGKALIRLEKEDEVNEISLIVNNIIRKYQEGIPYNKIAVVVRSNRQLELIKKVFPGANIPFFVVGDKLLFRDEINHVMAMLNAIYLIAKKKKEKLSNEEKILLNNALKTIFLEIKPLQLEFNTFVQLEKIALEEETDIFSIIEEEKISDDRYKMRFPLKDREIMGYFKDLFGTVSNELEEYDVAVLIELLTNETQYLHSLVEEGKMIGRLKAENIKYLYLYASDFVKSNNLKGMASIKKFIDNIDEKRKKQEEEFKIYNEHVKVITLNSLEDINYQIYYLV